MHSEYEEQPFRFIINLENLFGGAQPELSKRFLLMFANQYVAFLGCKMTVPTSFETASSLQYIFKSHKYKDQKI